jgi:fructokinase
MSYKVVAIGEVLWDMLPGGAQLGGAPANFAHHAHELGASARVISRVGRDDNGREILRRFNAAGLDCGGLQMDETAPTGTVTVQLSSAGVPEYIIHENVAWDRIEAPKQDLDSVGQADVICFGTLAQRARTSRDSIQCLLAASPAAAWRIFDINLRQQFYDLRIIEQSLKLSNVLKLNDAELPLLAGMLHLQGGASQQIAALAKRFDLRIVALTRGSHGSLLYQEGQQSECATRPVEIQDTVGAGDAFTAGLALGLLKGMDLHQINQAATEVARYVCSCKGATPRLPDSLRELFAKRVARP